MATNPRQPTTDNRQPARVAKRLEQIELSLIRQINALATPFSINLGIGEPNIEPDARLHELARRAATTSWHYSPNAGALSLRKKLCENTPFDPKSEVCVTAGTQEALFAIFTAFVDPGDEVLVPNPGFVSYATLAKICGASPVTYDLEPPTWEIDADALEKKITPRTKIIVVNSPSNPLGTVIPRATLERIAATGILVVSDEIYREIWYDDASADNARPRRQRRRAQRPVQKPLHDRPPPRLDPRARIVDEADRHRAPVHRHLCFGFLAMPR